MMDLIAFYQQKGLLDVSPALISIPVPPPAENDRLYMDLEPMNYMDNELMDYME